MRKVNVLMCAVLVLLLGAGRASALPTVDELIEKMSDAADKLKSHSADTVMKSSMGPMSQTSTIETKGMKVEKDGKTVTKTYTLMKMRITDSQGQTTTMERKVVSDGTYRWQEMKHPSMPAPMVTKTRANDDAGGMTQGQGFADGFKMWKEVYTLRVTGEDSVDGEKVYVLEGTFKDAYLENHPEAGPMKAMTNTMKMYISQKDMFPRKVLGFNPQGQQTMSMEYKNIKIDPKLDESLFKYTPPPGARVNDRTGE